MKRSVSINDLIKTATDAHDDNLSDRDAAARSFFARLVGIVTYQCGSKTANALADAMGAPHLRSDAILPTVPACKADSREAA